MIEHILDENKLYDSEFVDENDNELGSSVVLLIQWLFELEPLFMIYTCLFIGVSLVCFSQLVLMIVVILYGATFSTLSHVTEI